MGIDLHRRRFRCGLRRETGRNDLSAGSLEPGPQFVGRLRPTDEVAGEVTGNPRLFDEAVSPEGARGMVVDSNPFRVISHSVKKTDPPEARNLARYLAKGLRSEVRRKEQPQAEVARRTPRRDRRVKLRPARKNQVNHLRSGRGIELDQESLSSEKGWTGVREQRIEPGAHLEREVIGEQIRSWNRSLARRERALAEASPKLPGYRHLTCLQGMGSRGAGILLSGMGEVKDFDQAGKLAADFGIVPRVQDSPETEPRGRLPQRGSKLGRTALVPCARIAKRYRPDLDRYDERLRARRGTGKALIAWARKFLSLIDSTLKNNWIFDDFPNFVLAQAKT